MFALLEKPARKQLVRYNDRVSLSRSDKDKVVRLLIEHGLIAEVHPFDYSHCDDGYTRTCITPPDRCGLCYDGSESRYQDE